MIADSGMAIANIQCDHPIKPLVQDSRIFLILQKLTYILDHLTLHVVWIQRV